MIDNQGSTIFSQSPAFMYGADGGAIDAATSDQLFSGVYLLSPSASTYLGGGPLTRFEAGTKTSRIPGALPTGSDLGGTASERVFVTPISAGNAFGGFFACRLSGAEIVSTGSAVYTFNPGQANSLVQTTTQVQ